MGENKFFFSIKNIHHCLQTNKDIKNITKENQKKINK